MRPVLFLVVLASCTSSKEERPVVVAVDSALDAPDTVVVEDNAIPDTMAPKACIEPLDAAFACRAPKERAGRTVCTDAAINAALVCFGTDTKGCMDATTKYPECSACVRDWLEGERIDFASCVAALDKTGSCPTTVQCTLDCLDTACASCDTNAGTGSSPSRSARDDCERTVSSMSGGACWDLVAKDYAACAADPKLSVCFPKGLAEMLPFFRGACRDGGDWSRAFEAVATDAATD